MKHAKIISICLLLICVSFIFVGCANVNYTTIKYSNGEIVETVNCVLNEQLLIDKGYNVELKKNSIATTAYLALQDKYSEYIAKINQKREQAIINQEHDKLSLYEQLLESVNVYQPAWTKDVLVCKIHFKSATAYYLFYDLKQPNFQQAETKKNLFTNKIYYRGNLGYSINHGLYSTIANKLDLQFMKFSAEDVNLTYSYLAPARRYHSNANYIQSTSDGYLHTWVVGENLDEEIYFYLIIANRHAWYLLAIAISLLVCFILLLVGIIKIYISKNKKLVVKLIKATKNK